MISIFVKFLLTFQQKYLLFYKFDQFCLSYNRHVKHRGKKNVTEIFLLPLIFLSLYL